LIERGLRGSLDADLSSSLGIRLSRAEAGKKPPPPAPDAGADGALGAFGNGGRPGISTEPGWERGGGICQWQQLASLMSNEVKLNRVPVKDHADP